MRANSKIGWVLAASAAAALTAAAVGAQPTRRYEWYHTQIGNALVSENGRSALDAALNTLEGQGWEVFTVGVTTHATTGERQFDVIVRRSMFTAPAPAPAPAPTSTCGTVAPAPEWACVNGGWIPPGHPLYPRR